LSIYDDLETRLPDDSKPIKPTGRFVIRNFYRLHTITEMSKTKRHKNLLA